MTKFTVSTGNTALMATSKDYIEDTESLASFVHGTRRVAIESEVLRLSRLYARIVSLGRAFTNLVEAAVAMRYGPTNGGWGGHEIVHRDLKPGNSQTPGNLLTHTNAY